MWHESRHIKTHQDMSATYSKTDQDTSRQIRMSSAQDKSGQIKTFQDVISSRQIRTNQDISGCHQLKTNQAKSRQIRMSSAQDKSGQIKTYKHLNTRQIKIYKDISTLTCPMVLIVEQVPQVRLQQLHQAILNNIVVQGITGALLMIT